MFIDYQCKKCETTFEYHKPYGIPIPETVPCVSCEGEAKRLWNGMPLVDIAIGHAGNAKNGYQHNTIYKPSKFAPLNKIQGRNKYNDPKL
jgi:hypothetical protein